MDESFPLAELTQGGNNMLSTSRFKAWEKYAELKITDNPKAAMVSAMLNRYSNEELAGILGAARKVEATKINAESLQTALINIWLKKGVAIDTLFTDLKLETGDSTK